MCGEGKNCAEELRGGRACGSASTSRSSIPKYTTGDALYTRLSYFQIATHLCSPSRETQSTTYSSPTRYSWMRTSYVVRPSTFFVPSSARKASRTCWWVSQIETPSEPAPTTGLTTALNLPFGQPFSTFSTSFVELTRYWPHALRPASRTASVCSHLLRRSGEFAVPLVGTPSASDSSSPSSTPVSQPTSTARSRRSPTIARTVAVVEASAPSSCCTTPM